MSKLESKFTESPSSLITRPEIVIFLGSLCFSTLMIDYFVKLPILMDLSKFFSTTITTIEWFALCVGTISVLRRNVRNIQNQRKEWFIDVISASIIISMLISYYYGGARHSVFSILNTQVRGLANTAVFALHGFLVFSATFRAFRVSSPQKLVAMILMFLTMLSQVPIGDWVWPGIAIVGDFLTNVLLSAGSRAIVTCSAIGMVVLGVRVLLGTEEQTYGLPRRRKK